MSDRNYRDTLNLPKTDFPMRANLPKREPAMLEVWQQEGLYQRMVRKNAGKPRYILHDGPPYANGHLHAGHILNKVLKDIIVKVKALQGFDTEYIPGWDCHGLPIERNVEQEVGRDLKVDDPVAFRQACRRYAQRFVDIQRQEFERLGCLGDWDHPYLTMSHQYEARILEELGRVVASGGVYRGKKPVYWCSDCETALAEAEVEHQDHSSPSVYVRFALSDDARAWLDIPGDMPASVVIWTTTPWTLPANLAVAFHPRFDYVMVEIDGERLVLAEGLLLAFLGVSDLEGHQVIKRFKGAEAKGYHARHPFVERESVFVTAEYVTLETGTGCVHTAPGHGREDYETGLANGLEPYSPVDDKGRFTAEVPQYQGRLVFDTNDDICAMLDERGALVARQDIDHSYPHCWRCSSPIIFRSTEQWFLSMAHAGLRERALDAIRGVRWIPGWGEERIHGMVANRPDWCLSRQRHWGIPIIAFHCEGCDEVVQTPGMFDHIVPLFKAHGADAWFSLPLEELIPPGLACPSCGGASFRRERDILDVWFDSGVSYAAVIEERYGPEAVTDLYLEGSDQHRGWFHSALLQAVASRGRAPYKAVLTHGFTVDGKGHKLSKRLGNYVPPDKILKKYGAEILRLWVAAEDYRDDIRISEDILKSMSDLYRKIRNTLRFLLANLGGFDPASDRVPEDELLLPDRMMLALYRKWKHGLNKAYEDLEFHRVVHQTIHFFTTQLSNVYLDFLKDRLYAERADDPKRRSALTVMDQVLRETLVLLAPIVSYTADEAWRMLPHAEGSPSSVFEASWPDVSAPGAEDLALAARWESQGTVRREVATALEAARNDKIIGHTLEAAIHVRVGGAHPATAELRQMQHEMLRESLIVSQVTLSIADDDRDEVHVEVTRAEGEKCARCWVRSTSVGQDERHPALCARCVTVLEG